MSIQDLLLGNQSSINQFISQSINQIINQSINQIINQSIPPGTRVYTRFIIKKSIMNQVTIR